MPRRTPRRKANPRRFGRRRFALDSITVSKGVARLFENTGAPIVAGKAAGRKYVGYGILIAMLDRHARGDWGEVDAENRKLNDRNELRGDRVLSVFGLIDKMTGKEHRVWLITEQGDDGRRQTTVLLPEEY